MPFGLRNAPQTFQRHIDQILSSCEFAIAYVDDVIIGSEDYDTHKSYLEKLLQILHLNNLQINPDKCHFFQQKVWFLGHRVSGTGV